MNKKIDKVDSILDDIKETCPICGHESILNQKSTKSIYYNEYVCKKCGTEWNIKVK